MLADLPPPMFVGDEITFAISTTGVAAVLVIALIVWNRRVINRKSNCRSCGHPFHRSHPDRCIDCGRIWRNRPLLPVWIMLPLVLIILTCGLAYPTRQAYLWSRERGWSPPLPMYKYKIIHRYPTGHTAILKKARNTYLGLGNSLVLRSPHSDAEIELTLDGIADGYGLYGPLPVDITGDGLLDVVVVGETGYLHLIGVYSLQPDGSFIQTLDSGGYFEASLQDLDGDGTFELIESDSRFSYTFAPRAFFSVPSMTSSFTGTSWVCDTGFMKRPPPEPDDFEKMKERLRENDWSEWPDPDEFMYPMLNEGSRELWSAMLELTYAGHGQLALDLHESVWPDDAGNKDEGRAYFLKTVREHSSIWEDLKAMQDPPVVAFESIPEPESTSE
ncbi:MAG TPA: hypothetical protein DCX60_03615 [Phycisphaerales bacterium]|nr:hypothetical protein [Phycisphaerales bacterium]